MSLPASACLSGSLSVCLSFSDNLFLLKPYKDEKFLTIKSSSEVEPTEKLLILDI